MRATRLALVFALALGLGCRSGRSVPETGSALLRLDCGDGVSAPDELLVWVYDDKGTLWNGARIPEEGALASESPSKLGTILIAPGAVQGALRIHIRAFTAGVRVADGMLAIPSLAGERTFDLRLEATVPPDSDGDDVPDGIDDCVGVANPAQGGCAAAPMPDAGTALADGRPGDGGDNPVSSDAAWDSMTGGDGKTGPADGGTTAGQDTKGAGTADTRIPTGDAPGDTPISPQTDTKQNLTVDGKAPVFPDGAALSPDGARDTAVNAADSRLADLLVVSPDVRAPADLAFPADSAVARDALVLPPDSGAPDVPEEDACSTNCKKSQGDSCNTNDECASGFCADGICCTNACAGPCRSCNLPSAVGTCQGYAENTNPEGECVGGAMCNGAGACGSAPPTNRANGELCRSGSECASGFCSDKVCCNEACNLPCQTCGRGACVAVTKADDTPECTGTLTCNAKGKCVTKPVPSP